MNWRAEKSTLSYLTSLPTHSVNSHFVFNVDANIPFGSYILPTYSKGLFICSGADAVLIAIDVSSNIYVAFRNRNTWQNFRKI